jgi:CheY-like chemotaxis protein
MNRERRARALVVEKEAVAVLLEDTFDLVTLDHRMPGLKGMDPHKVLSQESGAGKRTTGFTPKKLPPIPIVTGYAEDPEVIRGQWGEGVVGVLQKPVHRGELERVVRDPTERGTCLR